jgi:flagellar hook-associated protein 3
MMRVTLKSVTGHMQDILAGRYSDLAKVQEQMSTGKRILRPSDDPVGTANDLKLRTTTSLMEQHAKNISDGLGFMSVSDTAMVSMNSIFQRMRELAIQASNDTISPNERIYVQKEVDQLFRQIISLVNTNYKGDYVFGGTQNKIAPFPVESSLAGSPADYQKLRMSYFDGSATGVGVAVQIRNAFDNSAMTNILPGSFKLSNGATTYVEGSDYTIDYTNGAITPLVAALAADLSDGGAFTGPNYQQGAFSLTFDRVGRGKDVFGTLVANSGDILREIEPGITMPINIPGDEVITNSMTGTNMITSMIRFSQNLIQNNRQGVSNAIDDIDNVLQAVLTSQTKNGARINRFETTQERNETQVSETYRLRSDLEDADLAETATQFSLMETVYNAALKSAALAIKPSLVDYL